MTSDVKRLLAEHSQVFPNKCIKDRQEWPCDVERIRTILPDYEAAVEALAEVMERQGCSDYDCGDRIHAQARAALARLREKVPDHEHQFVNPANEVVADNGALVCVTCGLLGSVC